MREIVLDTETTGLDPFEGHRLVEIGAVELQGHMPTGRHYHQYINPQRDMPPEAFAVHGLGDDFLRDKPLFAQIADEFLAFVKGGTLVIHNAAFDMKFLNAELDWARKPQLPTQGVVDTLAIARRRFPGSPASLDALCRRFGIDNSARDLHGALLDSEILAEVYLELMGGRQPDFALSTTSDQGNRAQVQTDWRAPPRPSPLPPRLSADDQARLDGLAQAVLDARAAHPGSTLADLYDPDVMPVDLRKAHRALDQAVDRLYRKAPFDSDRERVEHLFTLYEKMTGGLLAVGSKPKRAKRKSN